MYHHVNPSVSIRLMYFRIAVVATYDELSVINRHQTWDFDSIGSPLPKRHNACAYKSIVTKGNVAVEWHVSIIPFCPCVSSIFGFMASLAEQPLPLRTLHDPEKASDVSGENHKTPEVASSQHDLRSEDEEPESDRKLLLKWNASRATTFKSLATFYGLLVLGLNDAVYGVWLSPNFIRSEKL